MASGPLGSLAGLRSLPSSAMRVLATAVGFIVLVAALFAGVDAWQDRDLTAAPRPVTPAPQPDPTPAPAPGQGDVPDDGDPDDADGAAADEDADDAEDATPAPPAPPANGPRPQDVTVQLLNGSGVDGATAPVRSVLDAAGFRITAASRARPRDVTTIYYTVDFEAQGRLVASVLATDQVFPMTDLPPERRLSPTVMVHVIVGADRR